MPSHGRDPNGNTKGPMAAYTLLWEEELKNGMRDRLQQRNFCRKFGRFGAACGKNVLHAPCSAIGKTLDVRLVRRAYKMCGVTEREKMCTYAQTRLPEDEAGTSGTRGQAA